MAGIRQLCLLGLLSVASSLSCLSCLMVPSSVWKVGDRGEDVVYREGELVYCPFVHCRVSLFSSLPFLFECIRYVVI